MTRFAAVIAVLALVSATARAEYTINVLQVDGNVVASGSGTIDLTGLSYQGTGAPTNIMNPGLSLLQLGSASEADVYTGSSGPNSFGPGGTTQSSSQTGDFTGIAGEGQIVEVPSGYVSGTPLAGTATWDNATFSSLGLTPGMYTYIWNSGPADDSIVLNIGPAVAIPEPSSISLIGAALGCVGIGVCLRRRGAVPAVS